MKDRFSKQAKQYVQFRPLYPPELFEFIYAHLSQFCAAWDAGTGNGQAAWILSKKFEKVFATDISEKQLVNAQYSANIFYSVANERSSLANQSVDLVTVAQAAHWFDMKLFAEEVNRVLKPDGLIAVWGYGLLTINKEIDYLINHFYHSVIGNYWDKERRHIEEHYANLYFPFKEILTPSFAISVLWNLDELKGYFTTWSSVQKYITANGENPAAKLMKEVAIHWKGERQIINFPVFLRLGMKR
jgi:SAM-dependent methyltransferase